MYTDNNIIRTDEIVLCTQVEHKYIAEAPPEVGWLPLHVHYNIITTSVMYFIVGVSVHELACA